MSTNSYAFSDYIKIEGSNVVLGKGAGNASLVDSWNTIVGRNAGQSLVSGAQNTIIGNGANAAATTGHCTIIGHDAVCSATSGTSKVILIGSDAKISATHTSVCVLGGQTNDTSIVEYGSAHLLYMPFPTYTASATATHSITASEVVGGIILVNSAFGTTLNFPTQAQIFAAMKDPVVGSGFRLMVCKHGAGGITYRNLGADPVYRNANTGVTTASANFLYFIVVDATPAAPVIWVRGSLCNINT